LITLTKTFNKTTMEIDSFYQDGDMSFGMDGRINFADEFSYARGSEGPSRADQVAQWYPISDDCVAIENSLASIEAEIGNNASKIANTKTKKGEKRVLNDYNNILTSHKKKLEDKFRTMNCKVLKQQAEDQSFLSQLSKSVGASAQGATGGAAGASSGSKTMNYVLYALGGLTLIGVAVVVIKKMKG
jgi:hypothetical protein